MSIDDVAAIGVKSPCMFCGVFRKRLLNKIARSLGARKLATGHNLDDETQTILMNYMRGDTYRLFGRHGEEEGFVPRIKPLRRLPEREVILYGYMKGLYMDLKDCPYAKLSLRSEVRRMLNELEDKYPGTKHTLLKGYEKILGLAIIPQHGISKCKICGKPSAKEVCKACTLLKLLRESTPYSHSFQDRCSLLSLAERFFGP